MISLYRGELHKVSGVPRQWPFPKPSISLPAFKLALEKRHAALCRHNPNTSLPSPSQTVSETPPQSATEELERKNAVERRADSSGKLKELEFKVEVPDEMEDRSKSGEDIQHQSPVDSAGISKPVHASKLEGREEFDRDWGGGDTDRRENRKRKREDDPADEDWRIIEKTELSPRYGTGIDVDSARLDEGSEPRAVDEENQEEELNSNATAMDADVREAGGCKPVKGAEEAGPNDLKPIVVDPDLGLLDMITDGSSEAAAKVEAPATPPACFEEQIPGKKVEEHENARKDVNTAEEAVIDIKAKKREELEAMLKKLTAEKHQLVQMLKQVLSSKEDSKWKGQGLSQSPSSTGGPHGPQGGSSGADLTTVTNAYLDTNSTEGTALVDLEEGELDYARTPSPPSHTPMTEHLSDLGAHPPLCPSPSVVPVLGRQPSVSQHVGQAGAAQGGYFMQGLGIPVPGPAAGAGAISPGSGFIGNLPLTLGGRPYPHNLAMQHAAALHAQKVAAAAAAAGHPRLNPLLSGAGPALGGSGVAGGPPGFSGYGVAPSVHNHHGHVPQGASPAVAHSAGQQGVVSSSLLTTPRSATGYHDTRAGNPSWPLQR